MKKQNGITLIALIVSIIVMLILVAVTVQIITEGGLIDKASQARDDTESAMANEKSDINEAVYNIENVFANDPADFEVSSGMPYEIDTYIGTSTEVVVPSTINGVKITSIGGLAFNGNTDITKVVLPSTITEIGNDAFAGCTSLDEVIIPNSVVKIGDDPFNGTPFLTNLFDEDGVAIYNHILLATNYSFISTQTSYEIPANITTIARGAFGDANLITSITFATNSQIKYINTFAFNGCSSLESISIPNTIIEIGASAFNQCDDSSLVISIDKPSGSISGAPWAAGSSATIQWAT